MIVSLSTAEYVMKLPPLCILLVSPRYENTTDIRSVLGSRVSNAISRVIRRCCVVRRSARASCLFSLQGLVTIILVSAHLAVIQSVDRHTVSSLSQAGVGF